MNYNCIIGKYALVTFGGKKHLYKIEGHRRNKDGHINLTINSSQRPHPHEGDTHRRINYHSCYIDLIQRFPNKYYIKNGYKRTNILRMLKSSDKDTYKLTKEIIHNLNLQYKKESKDGNHSKRIEVV